MQITTVIHAWDGVMKSLRSVISLRMSWERRDGELPYLSRMEVVVVSTSTQGYNELLNHTTRVLNAPER